MTERDSTATGGRADAARKRAAIELIARHERALRRTARRFSLDPEDAEDAYQRALEILLTKAPTTDQRQLIRWTQTVTKHEAMAVRESREKLLGANVPRDEDYDPLASLPARGDGPDERAARSEVVARGREALAALKPAELRALSLLASGYSYAEIGRITGFSQTKINRVLAEGRERFRGLFASSEDGSRCRELRPLLSSFCDGEASAADAATVRAHLRACAGCRATVRAYRAAPRIAAGLVPALPASRSLFERLHDAVGGLWARVSSPGGAADSVAGVAATGGARGVGVAGLTKLAAICAGGAACVATGVVPAPFLAEDPQPRPAVERQAEPAGEAPSTEASPESEPVSEPEPQPEAPRRHDGHESATRSTEPATGAVEYESPPAPVEAEAPASNVPESAPTPPSAESAGSAAGEFGP
ncbi:MAG TPA: sigma-70 family RNA polymerase sigma factor [Solirubrobacterales bacterium]